MSDERPPGMSDDFQARMRLGLSTMAVRERVRERRRNRAIGGAAVAAAVVAVAAVLGGQVLAGGASERDIAGPSQTAEPTIAPTTPAVTDGPATETPAATETAAPEPTPPAGFDGVAAGQPYATTVIPRGDVGDAGAAGGPDPRQVDGIIDVYVLCEGAGRVVVGDVEWVDCADLQPGTVSVDLGRQVYREYDEPEIRGVDGFDGVIREVPAGESPPGLGVGGTATVYVQCALVPALRIGGVAVTDACGPVGDDRWATDVGAWGIPFGPDELVPRIETQDDGQPLVANGTIRFVIER